MEQNITPQPKKAFYNLSPFILILGIISIMSRIAVRFKDYSIPAIWLGCFLLLIWIITTKSRNIIEKRREFYNKLIKSAIWIFGLSLFIVVVISGIELYNNYVLGSFLLLFFLFISEIILVIILSIVYEIMRYVINRKNSMVNLINPL